MTTPKEITWDIEPHTRAKHEILRRYLGAWFPILGSYNSRIVYIDGFCGPGRYKGGEDGSPIIALKEAQKQPKLNDKNVVFLFVDERADRIDHLNSELEKFPTPIPSKFNIQAESGQFDGVLRKLLDELDAKDLRLAPTFAFIDPFGFKGLPFDLVRRLLANDKTEVFVNVMVDAINRFLAHPDDKTRQHIVELFGTDEVLQIAQKPCNRVAELRLLYQKQLSQCARFVRYFEMKDCYGKTIYYLFFASNNQLGHAKMKEAFWKVDRASGFCFSDATNPDQLVLFEVDETPKLATDLAKKFAREKTNVGRVQRYVEDETSFLATHMKKALKKLEDEGGITVSEYKRDGSRRKKNTYPEDAIVEFA